MAFFGPGRDEVWRQLAEDLGAEYQAGFWKGGSVRVHNGPWTLTLDTYTESTGHTYVTYTRMRAPFVNPEGFRFTVYRKGVFTELGKLLGMQDVEVGDPEFDEAFVVQSGDEARVRNLLAEPRLRRLLEAQPTIQLSVKDSEGWFGPRFPADVDELHFQVTGVIKDRERLRALFDLFAELLDRLCRIGSSRKDDPGVTL